MVSLKRSKESKRKSSQVIWWKEGVSRTLLTREKERKKTTESHHISLSTFTLNQKVGGWGVISHLKVIIILSTLKRSKKKKYKNDKEIREKWQFSQIAKIPYFYFSLSPSLFPCVVSCHKSFLDWTFSCFLWWLWYNLPLSYYVFGAPNIPLSLISFFLHSTFAISSLSLLLLLTWRFRNSTTTNWSTKISQGDMLSPTTCF